MIQTPFHQSCPPTPGTLNTDSTNAAWRNGISSAPSAGVEGSTPSAATKTRTCDNCGRAYEYARSTSKFCSRRCRSHAHLIKSRRVRVPADMRYTTLAAHNFTCTACGASPRKDPDVTLHIDHIVPLSQGGAAMDPRNLTVLCSECNLGKSNS